MPLPADVSDDAEIARRTEELRAAGVSVVIDVSSSTGSGQQLQARRSAWVVSASGRSP